METHPEYQYLDLLKHILLHGTDKGDRTGTGTRSVFGYQMCFDLSKGFPLLTTKKMFHKAIVHELLWFLRGETNIQYLVQNGVHIWDDWPYAKYQKAAEFGGETIEQFADKIATDDEFASKWGDLGPVYGSQWRKWPAPDGKRIDQFANLIDQIKQNPNSRRLIITAWNPDEVDNMALPPCHCLFQFYVVDGRLSCQLYQRSADVFLGVPFNIASYALLTMMVAQVTGLELGEFVHTFGDVHIYSNHLDQVKEQMTREPFPFPTMKMNPAVQNIFDFKFEDFELENYVAHERIKAPIAV